METPTFYATIPASVRYDKRLKPAEKLLFAEICALTNVTGYCYATNSYFETLFDASTRTVQGWLKHLQDCGFISIVQVGGGAGEPRAERRISPLVGMACVPMTPAEKCATPAENCGGTPAKKCATPPQKNAGRLLQDRLLQDISIHAGARAKKSPEDVFAEYADGHPALLNTLGDFIRHREGKKKPLSIEGAVRVCRRLDALAKEAGVSDADGYKVAVLDQSMERGWDGLFPLKYEFADKPVVHASPGGAAPAPRQIGPDEDISKYF